MRFIDFGPPNGSQTPPPPAASKMAAEWLPDDSQMIPQMIPRCLSASSPQLTSAQPAQLSQLSSAISAQPAQLKIGFQSGTRAGLTKHRLSGRSLNGFVVVFWGALKTWIWGVSASSAQPSHLSHLSSASSAQPAQLSHLSSTSSASSAKPSQLSQLSSAISAQPSQLSQLSSVISAHPS